MSKKKHFAGKKTKLAKLALTETLSRQMTESENWSLSPEEPGQEPAPASRQLPLGGESETVGGTQLLARVCVQITWELGMLQAEMLDSQGTSPPKPPISGLAVLPTEAQLNKALRQTGKDLAALSHSLSYTLNPQHRKKKKKN